MASAGPSNPLGDGQVEIWKKIVDVQQHFNDLELRIRNFALAVSGAFLGLGGYAIKDGGFATVLGLKVSVAGIVVLTAVFPLAAFYFMDRFWYHRLLQGSVAAGVEAEGELKTMGYRVDLGTHVTKASPFSVWFFGSRTVRSKNKMDLFYLMLLLSLLLVSGVLAFGVKQQPGSQSSLSAEAHQGATAEELHPPGAPDNVAGNASDVGASQAAGNFH